MERHVKGLLENCNDLRGNIEKWLAWIESLDRFYVTKGHSVREYYWKWMDDSLAEFLSCMPDEKRSEFLSFQIGVPGGAMPIRFVNLEYESKQRLERRYLHNMSYRHKYGAERALLEKCGRVYDYFNAYMKNGISIDGWLKGEASCEEIVLREQITGLGEENMEALLTAVSEDFQELRKYEAVFDSKTQYAACIMFHSDLYRRKNPRGVRFGDFDNEEEAERVKKLYLEEGYCKQQADLDVDYLMTLLPYCFGQRWRAWKKDHTGETVLFSDAWLRILCGESGDGRLFEEHLLRLLFCRTWTEDELFYNLKRIQDSYLLDGENRLKAETFADRLPELVLEETDAQENPLLAVFLRLRGYLLQA